MERVNSNGNSIAVTISCDEIRLKYGNWTPELKKAFRRHVYGIYIANCEDVATGKTHRENVMLRRTPGLEKFSPPKKKVDYEGEV
jgi:hypothetical protein